MKKTLGLLAAITAGLAIGSAAFAAPTQAITFKLEVPVVADLSISSSTIDFNFGDGGTDLSLNTDQQYQANQRSYKTFLASGNQTQWFAPTGFNAPRIDVLTNQSAWHLTIGGFYNPSATGQGSSSPDTASNIFGRFLGRLELISGQALAGGWQQLAPSGTSFASSTTSQGASSYYLHTAVQMDKADNIAFNARNGLTVTAQADLTLSLP